MAGGTGTRLRPLTSNLPKPMIPVANRPMMEHVVDLLRRHGLTDIVVTLAFMPDAIRTYFGDGSDFGVSIRYAVEDEPLGTAGSVANAADLLAGERFLVISGDVITDVDLSRIVAEHEEKSAVATIGLTSVENPLEFGIVITREDGSIERFLEKPTWGQVFSDTINTGIFVLEPEVLDHIDRGRSVDFSGEVFPALLAEGKALYGSILEGYWEDVGTLDAYGRAHRDILDGTVEVDIGGFRRSAQVWIGEDVDVHPGADLEGPAIIGDRCNIGDGARLGPYSVVGNNVRLQAGATVDHCVVLDHTYLGAEVSLRGTVVGRSCDLRRAVRCEDGVVLGDEVFVGDHAVLGQGVKVFPLKTVEAGAIVNSSIVWESRGARSLFGRAGIAGLANLDLTPELVVRAAMAWASSLLPPDATVVTSRDTSRSARMLKRAAIAGLNASGVNVLDAEVGSIPLTRWLARSSVVSGGMTVRLDPDDPERVVIRLLDGDGADIDEKTRRKIERTFELQNFRRAMGPELGQIELPARAMEGYAASLEAAIDAPAVADRRFKMVVDYSFGSTSMVMPTVLAKLGADVLAVNPYASTIRATTVDREQQLAEVAGLVAASGAGLGAVFDTDGERLWLVDDGGRVLTPQETLFVFVDLVSRVSPGVVALPVSTPSAAEEIVSKAGGSVLWAKLSLPGLLEAARQPDVVFAAGGNAMYVAPSFLPAPDAAASLLLLLDLLTRADARLSDVAAGVPDAYVADTTVSTPWELKGQVMRQLVEQSSGRETVLVDGVKILHEGGWVLALPDPEEPITHVWAEGADERSARELAGEYARRIQEMLR